MGHDFQSFLFRTHAVLFSRWVEHTVSVLLTQTSVVDVLSGSRVSFRGRTADNLAKEQRTAYAVALYNQHVCPVNNWLYNESCEEELHLHRGPVLCCTSANIPLISKCGTLPPESCIFSLICNTGSFMVILIGLLRYAHVIEKHQNCGLNKAGLYTGVLGAAGLIMVGNFQVDYVKLFHYVGAGGAFLSSTLFVCLQSVLTYKLARTQGEYRTGHLRVAIALLALVTLVLGGIFFYQESFVLQHASAIFEWVYCMLIMLFYGTFAFEFVNLSGDTLMVLSKRAAGHNYPSSAHKTEVGGSATDNQPETML